MTYSEALDYLDSLCQFGYQPGLETIRRLSMVAKDPWRGLPCIHVAGTNGKGSVCALLDSIYRVAGYRTGLYTSPHLIHFGERIRVSGVPIPEWAVAEGVSWIRQCMLNSDPELRPTFFEFTTVLAWWWFARNECRVVILETGLGGRLDATNLVVPLASVITQIGWDHMQVLGATLAAIAAEKAGIIKPEVPVITGVTHEDAFAVIDYKARELDAPCIQVGEPAVASMPYSVGLVGIHQKANAAIAATTARLLRPVLPISEEALSRGLAEVSWPGRFQVLKQGDQVWVLDGAHNRDAAAAVRKTWESEFPQVRPTLILGVLQDKSWREMIREWLPICSRVITVPIQCPRAMNAELLLEACRSSGVARAGRAASSLAEALRWVSKDSHVLVTGSLYLVGEVLECLEPKQSQSSEERALNHWHVPGRAPMTEPQSSGPGTTRSHEQSDTEDPRPNTR